MEKHPVDEVDSEESLSLPIDPDGVMRHDFLAWIPDKVLVDKIYGLISRQATKIFNVSRDQIILRIGAKFLIPRTRNDHESPFILTLGFDRSADSPASMAHVSVEVHPLAWNISRDLVLARPADIIREVRACLMAQDIHRRIT